MRPDPSEFKDFTPEQIKSYLALRKNMQAEFFMKVVMGSVFGHIALRTAGSILEERVCLCVRNGDS